MDRSDLKYLEGCAKPKLFIQGANDQFGSRSNVEILFNELPELKKLVFVENADHFFTGHLSEMAAAIDTWLDERNPERSRNSAGSNL